MLKQSLTLFLLLTCTFGESTAEKGESIMFAPKEHPFTQAPQVDEGTEEPCTKLAKEIEALKGKPQRRHAALERYRLKCSNRDRPQ
ncbi:MAG: hypothetical protein AB2598_12135 [Candidatus Thiodiazotropha sp.]